MSFPQAEKHYHILFHILRIKNGAVFHNAEEKRMNKKDIGMNFAELCLLMKFT
jgi:hypothetical protein